MMQNPSMYSIPSRNCILTQQNYHMYPTWDPYSLIQPPSVVIDPMLQQMTPTRSNFQDTPIIYQNQLPTTGIQGTEPIPPHMVPLPEDNTSPSVFRQPHQANPQSPFLPSPQLHQGTIAPAT